MPAFDNQLTEKRDTEKPGATSDMQEEAGKGCKLELKSVERGSTWRMPVTAWLVTVPKVANPLAGGLPFVTPFGTVYSTNITPPLPREVSEPMTLMISEPRVGWWQR